MTCKVTPKLGFTIVELLVVIAVIGVLAAITMISYSGIVRRSIIASLQSDLTNISKQLKIYQVENDTYPVAIDCSDSPAANTICLKPSGNNVLDIHPDTTGNDFCATAKEGTQTYKITSNSIMSSGDCLGYGLVGYWPFDGNLGDINDSQTSGLQDMSGNDNNGTASNLNGTGMSFVTGKIGNAVYFDGVDDGIDNGTANVLKNSPILTISLWIKPMANSGIFLTQGWYQTNGWYVFLNSADNSLRVRRNIVGVNSDVWSNNNLFSLGVWNHLAIVMYNGQYTDFYINGQFDRRADNTFSYSSSDSQHLYIGTYNTLVNTYNREETIDDVRIYNRTLSGAEISTLFDNAN